MELIDIKEIKVVEPTIKLPDRNKDAIIQNLIDTFGQLRPLVVDQDTILIDGHAVYEAMKRLSLKEVWIKRIITSNRKQVYLELNLSQKDIDAVDCIKYMRECDLNTAALPWPPGKIEEMTKILDFEWDSYKKERQSDVLF